MKIYFSNSRNEIFSLQINENDYIKDVKIKMTHKIRISSEFNLLYNGEILEDDQQISSSNIEDGSTITYVELFKSGGYIDNIIDETNLNIGYDTNFLNRNELYINLIYFDLAMMNSENYKYFNQLKIDIIGGFHAIDDLNILNDYLDKIKEKNISFIVVTSGTSGKDVIPLCKNYPFVKEVIIFCKNYEYNEHYIKEYPGFVKNVFTCLYYLYEYIKTFGKDKYKDSIEKYKFSSDEIKMEKQIKQCPVISSIEYDEIYYLIHKAYSHFFGDINNINENPKFNENNLNKIKECLDKIKYINQNEKLNLISKFKEFVNINDNYTFVEKAIQYYTEGGTFCYLFNQIMRCFEPGLISFAYYMGPLLFGLNKYVKENPDYAMSKDMTLYRKLTLTEIEFYSYKLNLGHIICFPSLTSTSSQEIIFFPSSLAQSLSGHNSEKTINIKMIFKYKYESGNISPGIILEDKKAHYKHNNLSAFSHEYEVLLFPFTFARIKNIKSDEKNIKIIEMDIINRTSYIEYDLKNNLLNRIYFGQIDKYQK